MPENRSYTENFEHSRNAARITFDKVSSWEELNAATKEEGDDKFSEATRGLWEEFAVSGVLQFDVKEGKQVLRPFTDLDGRSALGLLREAGINTDRLNYVKPGEYLQGAINLDTGDKFGVVYEEPSYTAFFDHHDPKVKQVTSTTEIVYQTMADLNLIQRSETLDRISKFVTNIDNRKLPAEEFLRSGKTILGLQRDLTYEQLCAYFSHRISPTDELTPEDLERYGLAESAEKQQRIVDEAMLTLEQMEKHGKICETQYGSIVINHNNELKVGSSAAYVRHDGIINYSDKSFAVTLKDHEFNEPLIRQMLGDRFQGKFIRGSMWIYNDAEPLRLKFQDIKEALRWNRDPNIYRFDERYSRSAARVLQPDSVKKHQSTLVTN